jgi:hypothetical protein
MSVSNLTNGCKKATVELTKEEVLDLHLACLGRIRVILDLHRVTHDPEARTDLHARLVRMEALRDRLEQL